LGGISKFFGGTPPPSPLSGIGRPPAACCISDHQLPTSLPTVCDVIGSLYLYVLHSYFITQYLLFSWQCAFQCVKTGNGTL